MSSEKNKKIAIADEPIENLDEINVTEISRRVPNKFLLSVAVAKRARQLKDGMKPLINLGKQRLIPVIVALKEIGKDRVTVNLQEEQELEKEMLDKMDQFLDSSLAEDEAKDDSKDSKKKDKDKDKDRRKSKSLAA